MLQVKTTGLLLPGKCCQRSMYHLKRIRLYFLKSKST
uniref:Uncharacterized protein n=1 Tax=Anguilla anguilla TaxID=7936 RepID=A0A0E9PJM0_ANGAN